MVSKKESTFAGGCFWGIEATFQELKGVLDVISGYSNGKEKNPTYEEVSSGKTGHLEVVRVIYDPSKISYGELLDVFWKQIDPIDSGGQFADRGNQYKTAIFYHNEDQRKAAEKSKKKLEKSKKFDSPIVTEILPISTFYKAEEYHQNYYKKGSGREGFIKETWGKIKSNFLIMI